MSTPHPSNIDEDAWSSRTVFQPVIDLHAWRVAGFEALARFADGASPLGRLAEAEAAGRREELEIVLIRRAIASADALPDGVVTINASGVTILRDDLADALARMSRPWGIELFEAHTPVDLATIRARVTELGGELLVDDAGTSHADENRIRTLRPDVVKIDRGLFWAAGTDPAARARLEPIITATRGADARLLVEGVSEPEHVDLARDLGADLAQGFHLGMPTPAEEMPAALRELHRSIGMDAPGL